MNLDGRGAGPWASHLIAMLFPPILSVVDDGQDLPKSPWAIVGRFIERHGLSGVIVIMLAWMLWTSAADRRLERADARESNGAYATQLKDLNAQVWNLSSAFGRHADEGRQIIQVLRVMCVNQATTVTARTRCLGPDP